MSDRAVIVIPARYASSRLPGKPLIPLCGKPLIQRVYENAIGVEGVEYLVVATDDLRILEVVRGFGGQAVMTPTHLETGSERVGAVARDIDAEIIVNLQGDEPLVATNAISEAIRLLKYDRTISVATLAAPLTDEKRWRDPSVVKVLLDHQDNAIYFSRAMIPHPRDGGFRQMDNLMHHIGVYLYRKDFLLDYLDWEEGNLEAVEKLEQLRILERGHRIRVVKTAFASPGVDTAADVQNVERILRRRGAESGA